MGQGGALQGLIFKKKMELDFNSIKTTHSQTNNIIKWRLAMAAYTRFSWPVYFKYDHIERIFFLWENDIKIVDYKQFYTIIENPIIMPLD